MDANVAAASRQPLAFTTPASFSQSRLDKGRAVSMALPPVSSPSSPIPIPISTKQRLAQAYTAAPSLYRADAVPRSAYPFTVPGTPVSPNTPSCFGLPTPKPSLDTEMQDAFATPPMSRMIPSTSGTRGLTQLSIDTPPSSGRLLSKKGKGPELRSPVMPLTPPLTPPYQEHPILHSVDLARVHASPSPKPTTLSGRALLNHRLHPLFDASYRLCEELGSGGFGFVVRAQRVCDGLSVAVKFIERAKIPAHAWVKSRSWGETPGLTQAPGPKLVPMEAFVLRSIRHEGVVAFIDLFEDDKYFYLVMEHHGSPWQCPDKNTDLSSRSAPTDLPALAAASMDSSSSSPRLTDSPQTLTPNSSPTMPSSPLPPTSPHALSPPRPAPMERRSSCDLFECIEQHSRFDNATAKYVFAQIVEIVHALGQIGICHRDLKDENVVVDLNYRVKLIDFGSAVIFDPRQPPPLYHRFHGTTSFASAEILRGEPYQAPASEIWSLGVLLSILVTGECPFVDAEAAKTGRMSRPRVPLAPDVAHLLRSCLEVDVSKRITISQLRRHPWLSEVWARRAA
ncbi:hypothetical protein JCM5296_006332 [Sporobolomyces johnsonii]